MGLQICRRLQTNKVTQEPQGQNIRDYSGCGMSAWSPSSLWNYAKL